jgi:hypothetical protein
MTTRRWMIAVAAVCLLLACAGWWRWWLELQDFNQTYTGRAEFFRCMEELARTTEKGLHEVERQQAMPTDEDAKAFIEWKARFKAFGLTDELRPARVVAADDGIASEWAAFREASSDDRIGWWREQEKRLRQYADYLSELRSKYERAARRPWLPVPPDPPEPD